MNPRPPLPPFDATTAAQKARMAEDAWNSRDPERVALAYTEDSRWRNRAEIFQGRTEITNFQLRRKWAHELDYRLIKGCVGLCGKPHCRALALMNGADDSGHWFRS